MSDELEAYRALGLLTTKKAEILDLARYVSSKCYIPRHCRDDILDTLRETLPEGTRDNLRMRCGELPQLSADDITVISKLLEDHANTITDNTEYINHNGGATFPDDLTAYLKGKHWKFTQGRFMILKTDDTPPVVYQPIIDYSNNPEHFVRYDD